MQVTTGKGKEDHPTDGEFCPFIRDPDPDCHGYNLGNPEISSFMYFCGHNFRYCHLYQNRIQGRDIPQSVFFIDPDSRQAAPRQRSGPIDRGRIPPLHS